MLCLGIESTAHTFGCGIITSTGEILANAKRLFQTQAGGMVPNEVAKHHEGIKDAVLKEALDAAKCMMKDIGLIAYSRGPGLSPSLRVGKEFAKALCSTHKLPIIGVNHCVAHLTIGDLLCKTKDPVYVYVSGVNTQVIALAAGRMRVFGETLDIGLGNALDKFGRAAGLGFPAGPKIEELAKQGKFIELPYIVKGMDVSFAGLVTKAERMLKEGVALADLCYSFQETTFAMLAEVAERALAHTGKKELLLIGGVGANKRLGEMLNIMCAERGAEFRAVPLAYAGDQGAMIAWQGWLEYNAGSRQSVETADILPYERTDDVLVTWRS
ncbi:N(6)-L-threonylcarbamoyladenine synthase Kae1 [Candidatus Woesearchaeota archaeon]|nr:N(6)-L-threonylcarbamoyladenine synthase Kae1 [Candidatus Woesearchaeota archaeon]